MEKSPFALLPGELRNEIWRLCVVRPNPVILGYSNIHEVGASYTLNTTPALSGLFNTCRAIRSEVAGIFCGDNTFKVCGSIGRGEVESAISRLFQNVGRDHSRKVSSLEIRERLGSARNTQRAQVLFDTRMKAERECQTSMARYADAAKTLLRTVLKRGLRPEVVRIVVVPNCEEGVEVAWELYREAWDGVVDERRRKRAEKADWKRHCQSWETAGREARDMANREAWNTAMGNRHCACM